MQSGVMALGAIVTTIVFAFSSLTVRVDQAAVSLAFGWSIFKRRYLLREIVSARKVRNEWYYGWGIRYWMPGKFWLYNVQGLDAVELTLRDGKVRRIGTDDVENLLMAIQAGLQG